MTLSHEHGCRFALDHFAESHRLPEHEATLVERGDLFTDSLEFGLFRMREPGCGDGHVFNS